MYVTRKKLTSTTVHNITLMIHVNIIYLSIYLSVYLFIYVYTSQSSIYLS